MRMRKNLCLHYIALTVVPFCSLCHIKKFSIFNTDVIHPYQDGKITKEIIQITSRYKKKSQIFRSGSAKS